MSWSSFDRLWMDVRQIANSPSFDILLDIANSQTPNYVAKLAKPAELTHHVVAYGVFGPNTLGR